MRELEERDDLQNWVLDLGSVLCYWGFNQVCLIEGFILNWIENIFRVRVQVERVRGNRYLCLFCFFYKMEKVFGSN